MSNERVPPAARQLQQLFTTALNRIHEDLILSAERQRILRSQLAAAVVRRLPRQRSPNTPLFLASVHESREANKADNVENDAVYTKSVASSTRPSGQVSGALWGPRPGSAGTGSGAGKRAKETNPEPSLLISEIVFSGAEGDELAAARAANTLPQNCHATERDMIAARNALASTGLFSAISISITRGNSGDENVLEFKLKPNAEFKGHKVQGSRVLPPGLVDDIFAEAKGKTSDMNLYEMAADRIQSWYDENGVFGAVKNDIDVRKKSLTTGDYVFDVEEVEVGDVRLRFVDKKGNEVPGRTKPNLLQRYIQTEAGQVLRTDSVQRDVNKLRGLEVFDEVRIVPMVPAGPVPTEAAGKREPEKAQPITDLEYQVTEKRKFGSFQCSGGASVGRSVSDLEPIGTLSYANNNIFGLLQQFRMMFMMRKWTDKSVEVGWVNPCVRGRRSAQTESAEIKLNRANQDSIFGPARDLKPEEMDRHKSPIVERSHILMDRSVSLSDTVSASVGLGVNRNRCVDEEGRLLLEDSYRWPLAHNAHGVDKAATLFSSVVMRRDHVAGRISAERSVVPPQTSGWLDYVKADGQVMVEWPSPVALLRTCFSGGLHNGDLPAYDAHALGGIQCVRGYAEGELGTARHWGVINAEVERHLPYVANLRGVLFVDAGTDFNSGQTVVGDPAGSRNKPGSGFGYGAGLRLASPMGLIRFEYGWTGEAKWKHNGRWKAPPEGRFHIGIGSRF